MNLPELKEWAKIQYHTSDSNLISKGIDEKKVNRVKNNLKMIIEAVDIIVPSTVKNNRCMENIENAIKDLTTWGLEPPGTAKPTPQPEAATAQLETAETTNEEKI